jgi:uncharacterized protein YbbK (DUF523 family)
VILVSACLLGQAVRYDGRHSLAVELLRELEGRPYLALCPELLGGLGVPRPPARFQGARPGREGRDVLEGRARLVTPQGEDVTAAYLAGSHQALAIARAAGVEAAWLKDRSPACAWDPQGQNPLGGPGMGVLAALLARHGIAVREVRARAAD